MVEVMTDKATVTITAPKAGVVVETRGAGRRDRRRALRCSWSSSSTAAAAGARARAHANGTQGTPQSPRRRRARGDGRRRHRGDLPGMTALRGRRRAAASTAASGYFNEKPLATPATRKLARDLGVDLRRVPPSGPAGRVTRDGRRGVRGATARARRRARSRRAATPAQRAEATRTPVAVAPATARSRSACRSRGVRKRIAEKMAQSKHDGGALHLRRGVRRRPSSRRSARASRPRAEAQGVKLSFLPFIVKAVVGGAEEAPDRSTATLDEATQRDRLPQVLPHRHRGRDRRGAHRAGRARTPTRRASSRSPARSSASRDEARARQGEGRGPHGLDVHHHVARREGRPLRDADHQLPRGRASSAFTR